MEKYKGLHINMCLSKIEKKSDVQKDNINMMKCI